MSRRLAALRLAALAALLATAGEASARIMSGDEWRAEHPQWADCRSGADCVMVDAVCGAPQALNRKFLKEYASWLEKEYSNSVTDCLSVGKDAFVAVCRDFKCAARSKESLPDAWTKDLPGRLGDSSLDLSGKSVTAAGLGQLREMPKLRSLRLDGAELGASVLAGLRGLPRLEELSLTDVKAPEPELAVLRDLKSLAWLELAGTRVTDAGLEGLGALQGLRSLGLARTRVTDAGLRRLGGLWRLRHLNLAGTRVTDKGLRELATLKNLEELDLSGTSVTDQGLNELGGLRVLRKLVLAGTRATDAAWERIVQPPIAEQAGWPRDSVFPLQPTQPGVGALVEEIRASSPPTLPDQRVLPPDERASEVYSLPGAKLRLYQRFDREKNIVGRIEVAVGSGTIFGSALPICWTALRDAGGRDLLPSADERGRPSRYPRCGAFGLGGYGGDSGRYNEMFKVGARAADETGAIARAEGFLPMMLKLGRDSLRIPARARAGATFQLPNSGISLTWLGRRTRGESSGLAFALEGGDPRYPLPLPPHTSQVLGFNPEVSRVDTGGRRSPARAEVTSHGQSGEEYLVPGDAEALDVAVFGEMAVLVFPFTFEKFQSLP